MIASALLRRLTILGVLLPSLAAADPIALTFKDGSMVIKGEFVGFNEDSYTVATDVGEINVPASYVDCAGVDCITIVTLNDDSE